MDDSYSVASSTRSSPSPDMLPLTISPSVTSLDSLDEKSAEDLIKSEDIKEDDIKSEEKKPAKKRKSWGQELPTPKTNLPPRYVIIIIIIIIIYNVILSCRSS